MTTDRTIAETILNQLGGNKFTAMTGASGFTYGPRGLAFSLPRKAANGANKVIIDLSRDLYRVHFAHVGTGRNIGFRTVATFSDVQADQLAAIFTRETGLLTHL